MDEQPGVSDQYRMSSPWPLLIALSLPLWEVGLVLPALPLTIGGMLLFFGSIAGILREAGYVNDPWSALNVMAAAAIAIGAGIYLLTGGPATLAGALDVLDNARSAPLRGLSIVLAGIVTLLGSGVGRVWIQLQADPAP